MRQRLLAWAALLLAAIPAFAYVGGQLKNHNHTTSAGDGGGLSNSRITGTVDVDSLTVRGTITGTLTTLPGNLALGATTSTGTLAVWTTSGTLVGSDTVGLLQLRSGSTIAFNNGSLSLNRSPTATTPDWFINPSGILFQGGIGKIAGHGNGATGGIFINGGDGYGISFDEPNNGDYWNLTPQNYDGTSALEFSRSGTGNKTVVIENTKVGFFNPTMSEEFNVSGDIYIHGAAGLNGQYSGVAGAEARMLASAQTSVIKLGGNQAWSMIELAPGVNTAVYIATGGATTFVSSASFSGDVGISGAIRNPQTFISSATFQGDVGITGAIRNPQTFISSATFNASGGSIGILGNVGSNAYFALDQTPNSGKKWRLGHSGGISGYTSFDLYDETAGAIRLSVDTNGNVRIGPQSPSYLLDVNDDAFIRDQLIVKGSATFQGAVGFSTNLHNIQISTNLAGTSLGSMIAGQCYTSTLTITSAGSPAYVILEIEGSVYTTGGGGAAGISFLMDGTYVSPMTGGNNGVKMCGINLTGTGTTNANCRYKFIPSAGAHNFCLTGFSDTLSFVLGGNPANSANALFQWSVGEIK